MRIAFKIFIILWVTSAPEVRCQNITVTNSEKSVLSGTITTHKIFGHDAENYYVINYHASQFYIQKLDNQLNQVLTEPVKLFKGLISYEFQAAYDFYDEIYVFFTQYRFNEIVLMYQKMDKETLKPLTEPVVITTVQNVKGSWADFHFMLSKKESKLLVASRIKLPWSGAQFNEFYVFGKDMELIWKHGDTYEFKGQGPRDNLYVVDETGNVSILSLLKRESLITLLRGERNVYSIYRYTKNGGEFREYPVTLDDMYIRGIRIVAGHHGELICAGFYSEMLKSGVRGTFFFTINAETGTVENHTLNSFDEATMAELAELDEPIMREAELMNYVISDIVLRENQKMIIIAEQVFQQTYNTYNNLIVTSYDLNGRVYWTRVIAKHQNFDYNTIEHTGVHVADYRRFIREYGFFDLAVDNYCSYALMAPVDKTGIGIFYNDNISNLTGEGVNKPFGRPKKSYLLAIMIDEFGNIKRQPLAAWKKRALYPEPMRYYDTLSDTIIIPAFRNMNIGFLKLTTEL